MPAVFPSGPARPSISINAPHRKPTFHQHLLNMNSRDKSCDATAAAAVEVIIILNETRCYYYCYYSIPTIEKWTTSITALKTASYHLVEYFHRAQHTQLRTAGRPAVAPKLLSPPSPPPYPYNQTLRLRLQNRSISPR